MTPGGFSELSKYGKVFPIGIFLSLISLFAFGVTFVGKAITKKEGRGFMGFAILLLLLNIVFAYQQYTRHGVVSLFGISLDIKNILAILIAIVCFIVGVRMFNRRR